MLAEYRLLASMNNPIFPMIAHLSVTELKPRYFIELLKGIEAKRLLEVASRMQPSIRKWHALQGELNPELLTGLVDVDWVRMNQLAGNPCVATLIRRWDECQIQSDDIRDVSGFVE